MAGTRSLTRSLLGAVLAAGLLATAVSSCGRTTLTPAPSATPSSPSAARGDFAGLVDIGGGRRLYLECHGTGSPTVILQSGFGNASDIWSLAEAHPPAVAPGVATSTRVCAYDRPGSLITTTTTNGTVTRAPAPLPGRSDPAPMPRTAADQVAELHTLLATAGVPGPYVMVGHSLGGALSLLYARTYPDQVAGLVMVDAPQPFIRKMLTPQQWEEAFQEPVSHPGSAVPGYRQEAYDLTASFNQIEAAPPLRPMPVTVMARGKNEPVPSPLPSGYPAESFAAVERILPQAQAAFAASIPGARLITVPDTTHYIQNQRPDTVIDAIRQVIALAASPHPTTT